MAKGDPFYILNSPFPIARRRIQPLDTRLPDESIMISGMKITEQLLLDIFSIPDARAAKWAAPLSAACDFYGITTPLQVAAFLAQVGHESGRLRYVREIWGPTPWQKRYEGRADIGNVEPGDGFKYRGRGLIQITGRANYGRCGDALCIDLIENPELLEEPNHAAMSAAWFWHAHHLNDLADVGDMRHITRMINGGYNGLEERLKFYELALDAMRENGRIQDSPLQTEV